MVTLICTDFMRTKPSPTPPLRGNGRMSQEGVYKVTFSSGMLTDEETGPGEGKQSPRSWLLL